MSPNGIDLNRPALTAAMRSARRRMLHAAFGASFVTLMVVLSMYLLVQLLLVQRALVVAQTSLGNVRALEALSHEVLQVDAGFLDLLQQVSSLQRRWAPRLERLAELLPPNAWLTKVEAGVTGLPLSDERRRRLVLHVSARVEEEAEKMAFPMRLTQALQQDSLFASGYQDIRFTSTRILTGTEAVVVTFNVECQ